MDLYEIVLQGFRSQKKVLYDLLGPNHLGRGKNKHYLKLHVCTNIKLQIFDHFHAI